MMSRSRFVVFFLILLPVVMHARNIGNPHSHDGHNSHQPKNTRKEYSMVKPGSNRAGGKPLMHKGADPLLVAGSSLPDCTHACGSCTPCRLVMVSFVCSSIEEAETCPMAYKCMCKNKSYPIP